jgi:catechol 2,3-dioxygenase-like lactoylglutathione lyase family enzyme
MNFEGVLLNVTDLDRSIDFYGGVLGFALLSREDQLAAMSAPGSDRAQIIVLRELGSGPPPGGRHIGVRASILEAESADQLEKIAGELDSRKLLVSRRDHDEWSAVVGRDPDEVAVVVAWHRGADRTSDDSWRALDDFLYGIGE